MRHAAGGGERPAGAPARDDPPALEEALAHPEIARIARAVTARAAVDADVDADVAVPTRWAAVALVLRVVEHGAEMLMIKRAEYEGDPWSGHVALPGGRREPHDPTLADTAVRETREETAVDIAAHGRLLGRLDDVRPRTPRLPPIVIRPFVAVVVPTVTVVPSAEVADAFWVPLAALREPARWVESTVEVPGARIRVPSFLHGRYVVWGLTERVLRQFLEREES